MSSRARALLVAGGLALAVVLAVFVAPWASREPDGLERVATDQSFADHEAGHTFAASPAAGYATGPWRVAGVALVFVLGSGVTALAVRTRRRADTHASV